MTNTKKFQIMSKLYVEGTISGNQFVKIIVENQEIMQELDLAKTAKLTFAFLKGLRILKKLRVGNPLVVIGTECATYVCRKALVPRLISALKDSLRAITTEHGKQNVHRVIGVLEKLA